MPFLFVLLISVQALAWNPFATEEVLEVPLTKTELQKIKVNAGWAKGEDQPLIFEVTNGLKGPIQCSAANVELNDGKTVGKVFVPKFTIPGNAMRNASMLVLRGSMRTYSLTCSCFKKQGQGECVSPVK
ncbi:MAG: hypothetical protein WCO34_11690 [Betaproteobacteria bacterium]